MQQMLTRSTKVKLAALTSILMTTVGCDKGAGSFSVLSTSSEFKQESVFTPRKLDVLFVIDNSGSMASSQTNLANNFPTFINYFKNKGYDFKIAVTTTDAFYGDQFVSQGCSLCNINQTQFRSGTNPAIRVITSSTPNLESVFVSNALVGTSGSGDERAFSSFKAALNSSLNVGFHRSDAFLSVIIVSDADDFSHDDRFINESYTQPTLHSVSSYNTFLASFTGGTARNDYSVSTISVLDGDTSCRDALGSEMKFGTRYSQLADLTGGTKNSICAPFSSVLDNISSSIAGQVQAKFDLGRAAIVSTIFVILNGVSVPKSDTNGWSYDSTTHVITINGTNYQPSAGDTVKINFDPDLNAH